MNTNQIQFHISYDKAVEAIVWLANKKPGIDIYHVAKVLFYADKMHVNRYLRPVLGDTYIKMPYGPVPSAVRDLITQNEWLTPRHIKNMNDSLKIGTKDSNYKLQPKREPNTDYFSESDIECLSESLNKYGDMSFDELFDLTHHEKSYIITEQPREIDYALLVDDDNPRREAIVDHMKNMARYIQV